MQDWFKLYSTKNYTEANIVKGKLEENNIQAVLLNKQDSVYVVFGEIEIYVPLYFKELALQLLANTLSN